MSNNKQNSSIEWFAKESWKLRVELEDGKISFGEYANKYYQLKEQAKAMHKNEITKAVQKFQLSDKRVDKVLKEYKLDTIAEKYYNETFGGEDEQQ